jgi:hypothetical protein
MELIKLEDVLKKANEKYVDAKVKQGYFNPSYSPPEFKPEIRSEQLKAVTEVLIDELNQAIEDLRNEVFTRITERSSTCASLNAESVEPQ